ncbi:hypothetical protein QJS10_CPA05g01595 [Acorus calamus]|uniref:Uncharacterized protein n=1 Tax=Acorus calamus TaxID=4465 RepID=A0AAV9EU71_ACOCL|nr:hypothetical protein QJS10_CPA05g01595 [Acorus calamus]
MSINPKFEQLLVFCALQSTDICYVLTSALSLNLKPRTAPNGQPKEVVAPSVYQGHHGLPSCTYRYS